MKGVDPQTIGAFRQGAVALAQALRTRAGRELTRASGRVEPEEAAAVQLTRGQIQEITTLTEEIVSRWRNTRLVLTRLIEQLDRDERALQEALLRPVGDLKEAVDAVYGRGGG